VDDTSPKQLKKKKNSGVLVHCFAPGTRVLKASGAAVAIETLRVGNLVLGDDGQPKTVGAVIHGNQKAGGRFLHPAQQMYRVSLASFGSALSKPAAQPDLLVTGGHVLCVCTWTRAEFSGGGCVRWLEVTAHADDPARIRVARMSTTHFGVNEAGHARAGQPRTRAEFRDWKHRTAPWPLVVQVTAQQFLAWPAEARQTGDGAGAANWAMYSRAPASLPAASAFPALLRLPRHYVPEQPAQRLSAVLAAQHPGVAWTGADERPLPLVRRIAWLIGLWLADGTNNEPEVRQISGPHHEVVHELEQIAYDVHLYLGGAPAVPTVATQARFDASHRADSGQTAATLQFVEEPAARVTQRLQDTARVCDCYSIDVDRRQAHGWFRRLLTHYGLLAHKKHWPMALLSEPEEPLRKAMFAGFVDGDGGSVSGHGYRLGVAVAERAALDGVVHLARSFGYVCGPVEPCQRYSEDGSGPLPGLQTSIGGVPNGDVPTVLRSKRVDQPGTIDERDTFCAAISVAPEGGPTRDYHCVTLRESSRFLTEAGYVVSNCISGWDRTPLFISLLRLSLWADGEVHRSLNAAQILYLTVAYDWMLFGHHLHNRLEKGEVQTQRRDEDADARDKRVRVRASGFQSFSWLPPRSNPAFCILFLFFLFCPGADDTIFSFLFCFAILRAVRALCRTFSTSPSTFSSTSRTPSSACRRPSTCAAGRGRSRRSSSSSGARRQRRRAQRTLQRGRARRLRAQTSRRRLRSLALLRLRPFASGPRSRPHCGRRRRRESARPTAKRMPVRMRPDPPRQKLFGWQARRRALPPRRRLSLRSQCSRDCFVFSTSPIDAPHAVTPLSRLSRPRTRRERTVVTVASSARRFQVRLALLHCK
jgi:hypothetical protein